jgi:hypothetical protein
MAAAFPAVALADLSPVVTITFDEDGHGAGDLAGHTWTLRCEEVADPWGLRIAYAFNLPSAIFESALTYYVGDPPAFTPSVMEGDILLATPTEGFSDIIRFNYGVNGVDGTPPYATIVVYSNGDDSYDSLADVPKQAMPVRLSNLLWMPKQSNEDGWTGLQGYTPLGPGWESTVDGQIITHRLAQPGYMPGYKVTYNFTSQPVPVPGAVVLGFLGLGLVCRVKRRLT